MWITLGRENIFNITINNSCLIATKHTHTRTPHRIWLAIDALNYLIRSMFLAQTTAFLAFYSNSNPMHRLYFALSVDIQLNEKLALKVLALQMNRLKLKCVRYWRRCIQAPIQKQRKTRRKNTFASATIHESWKMLNTFSTFHLHLL